MKPTDSLTTLFNHHLWSNLRLLERCAELTPDQLKATMVGAYGSIYDTLQHIVTSEKSYFTRISTGQRYDRPDNVPPMSIGEMMDSMRETGSALIEWAPKLKADDMVEVDWEGTPRLVPRTILVTQALFHAAEHREQIKAIMTQIGVEPPDLQGWEFFDENYT
jgi:uncharacterized damage-inducible protein DinB